MDLSPFPSLRQWVLEEHTLYRNSVAHGGAERENLCPHFQVQRREKPRGRVHLTHSNNVIGYTVVIHLMTFLISYYDATYELDDCSAQVL